MRTGLMVICVFAAAWGVAALAALRAPWPTWAGPVLVSLALLAFFGPKTLSGAERSPEEKRRIGRLVGLWSGIEGVAVIAAANILPSLGMTRQMGPAVGVIVALHFLPLAHGLRFWPYYVTGAAMLVTSLLAALLPGQQPLIVSAAAAAVILWLTGLTFPRIAPGRRGGA